MVHAFIPRPTCLPAKIDNHERKYEIKMKNQKTCAKQYRVDVDMWPDDRNKRYTTKSTTNELNYQRNGHESKTQARTLRHINIVGTFDIMREHFVAKERGKPWHA